MTRLYNQHLIHQRARYPKGVGGWYFSRPRRIRSCEVNYSHSFALCLIQTRQAVVFEPAYPLSRLVDVSYATAGGWGSIGCGGAMKR